MGLAGMTPVPAFLFSSVITKRSALDALLAAFAGVLASALLLGAAWWFYSGDLSGVPDDGRMPVAMLPAFLPSYQSIPMLSDYYALRVWLFACAGFFLGPLVAGAPWRPSIAAGVVACAFAAALIGVAWISLPPPGAPNELYEPSFNVAMRTEGMLWVIGLAFAGAAMSIAIGVLPRGRRRAFDSAALRYEETAHRSPEGSEEKQ